MTFADSIGRTATTEGHPIMSYFSGNPYLTAWYCSLCPWQLNHSPPGRPEPPMSLSLKRLSAVWVHPLFLPSQALRAGPNCLRIDDLSVDPEETETSVSITGAHDTHADARREPSAGDERIQAGLLPEAWIGIQRTDQQTLSALHTNIWNRSRLPRLGQTIQSSSAWIQVPNNGHLTKTQKETTPEHVPLEELWIAL